MAETINLNIKVDKQLKETFDSLCDEMGLSMSMALVVFMKTVVRERRIPFEIRADSQSLDSSERKP